MYKNKYLQAMAVFMSLIMVCSSIDMSALAQEDISNGTIISVSELSAEVANQKLQVGAAEGDVVLPSSLTVIVEKEQIVEKTVPVEEVVAPPTEELIKEIPEEVPELIGEDNILPEDNTVQEPTGENLIDEIVEGLPESNQQNEPLIDQFVENIPEDTSVEPETNYIIPTEDVQPENSEPEENSESAPEESTSSEDESGESSESSESGFVDWLFPAIVANAEEVESAQEPEPAQTTENEEVNYTTVYETETVTSEVTFSDVTWYIDASASTSASFDSSQAGAKYVYLPSITNGYRLATSLPTITVDILGDVLQLTYLETVVDGVRIKLEADEGVFPEGVLLDVRKVVAAEEKQVEAAVEEVRSEEKNLVSSYTFDIKVLRPDGSEVQPDTSKGKVRVSFELESVSNENLETDIYHTTHEMNAEKLESETVGTNTVQAETDGFSYYTVEFTYNNLQYVMEGDTEILLQTILDYVGLTGIVTDVAVSNSELFSAEQREESWVIISHQPFTTEEWLKVTIDGVEYEIIVTDESDITLTFKKKVGNTSTGKVTEEDVTVTFSAFTGSDFPTSGNYYLTNDLNLSSKKVSLSGNLNLYLNGHTITFPEGNGSAIKVPSGVVFNLFERKNQNGKIVVGKNTAGSGNADRHGCGVYVSGAFNMYGGTLQGGALSESGYGGGVFIDGSNNASFNLYDGTITEFKGLGTLTSKEFGADHGGGVQVSDQSYKGRGSFYMYGGTISNNTGFWGGGIGAYGYIYIFDGKITGNIAKKGGGGIELEDGAKLYMYGGTITGNTIYEQNDSQWKGGGVHIPTGSEFHTRGTVTITNNKTGSGGNNNVYVRTGLKITVDGPLTGQFGLSAQTKTDVLTSGYSQYSEASNPDGFISDYPDMVVTTDSSGEIRLASHTHNWNYGVRANEPSKIYAWCTNDIMSQNCVYYKSSVDAAIISLGITVDDKEYDGTVYDGLQEDDHITAITGATKTYQYYQSDTEGATENGTLLASAPSEPGYYYVTVTIEDATAVAAFKINSLAHEHDNITFTKWTSTDSLPTAAGDYYLESNVTLSDTWTVPSGEVNLCLNGKTISRSNSGAAVIKVNSGSTLNVYDCDGNGSVTASSGQDAIRVNEGTLKLIEGTIESGGNGIVGSSTATEGTVYITGDSTVNASTYAISSIPNLHVKGALSLTGRSGGILLQPGKKITIDDTITGTVSIKLPDGVETTSDIVITDGLKDKGSIASFTSVENYTILQNSIGEAIICFQNAVILDNDSYLYGSAMSTNGVTLNIKVKEGTVSSYDWLVSNSRDGEYISLLGTPKLSNEMTDTYIINDATGENSGNWYKCIVNGVTESKPIQLIRPSKDAGRVWTLPYGRNSNNWYLSNGKMAYYANNNIFDVTGQYSKNGKTYMLQTSYGGAGWRMYSSNAGAPGATNYSTGDFSCEELRFRFSENNDYALFIDADLSDGQQAFSFGCDTQLGNSSTSGSYADYAALEAVKNSDNTLKQIAMIGAASSNDATNTDPAFVITPITGSPMYWLGIYSSRRTYSFNTTTATNCTFGDVNAGGSSVTNAVVRANRLDTGMTMSWFNVSSGDTVQFMFSVGDAETTGAVYGKINYIAEKLEGLNPNTAYTITVGSNTYLLDSDSNGAFALSGNDKNGHSYDFFGKNITVHKGNDTPYATTILARPIARDLDNPDTVTVATKPIYIRDSEVSVTENNIKVKIDPTDSNAEQKRNQEYKIFNNDGTEITGYTGWIRPNSNGQIIFSGLNTNTNYIIKSRVQATSSSPASLPSTGVTIKTAEAITVTEPTEKTANSDGTAHTFEVAVVGGTNTVVSYATAIDETYKNTVPTFTKGGKYTVYYRITSDNSVPLYGNYDVTVNPKVVFDANGGILTGGTDTFNVAYGGLFTDSNAMSNPTHSVRKFAGWYTDNTSYTKLWNLQLVPITEDITLYAKWVQNLNSFNLQIENVITLQLFKGKNAVSPVVPVDGEGNFTFTDIPDGEFNMVLVQDDTHANRVVTAHVKVQDDNIMYINLGMPEVNINSKLEVTDGAPDIVVANIDKEAMNTEVYWDIDAADNEKASNTSIDLILTASGVEDLSNLELTDEELEYLSSDEKTLRASQNAIKENAEGHSPNQEITFIDLTMLKKTKLNDDLTEEEKISETQEVFEIIVPFAINGKTIRVYRYHDGVDYFTEVSSRGDYVDGTFYVDSEANAVIIYTKKFSTYAISSGGEETNNTGNDDNQGGSGETPGTGGSTDSGETPGTGGSTDSGGTSGTGGSTDQGGTSGTGGSTDQGETPGTGGSTDQGGTSGTGGSTDQGETSGTGGSSDSGSSGSSSSGSSSSASSSSGTANSTTAGVFSITSLLASENDNQEATDIGENQTLIASLDVKDDSKLLSGDNENTDDASDGKKTDSNVDSTSENQSSSVGTDDTDDDSSGADQTMGAEDEVEANCYMHWYILALAIVAAVGTFLLRKKKAAKKIFDAVAVLLLALLAIIGSCIWDWILFVIGAIAIAAVIYKTDDRAEKQ